MDNKLFIFILILSLFLVGVVFAANVFPTTLNSWTAGDTIEEGWANALEAKIGVDNSAVTSSLDYLVRNVIAEYGGTGEDTSAWTGIAHIVAGTWTASTIDISSDTNLAAGTGLTLTDDTLSNDLGTTIGVAELASADFGDWTCNGSACTIDVNYIATITSTSTIAIVGSGSAGATITLDAIDLNCINCLNETEIEDIYVLHAGDDITGTITFSGAGDINLPNDSIDASDIDTINCGRSITWDATNDEVDIDSEIYTKSFSIVIKNATTTNNAAAQHSLPNAITITKIKCSDSAATTTIQFDERAEATPWTGGTDIMSAALVCGLGVASTTAFDNSGVAADAWISLDIDAIAGVSTSTVISIEYTIND